MVITIKRLSSYSWFRIKAGRFIVDIDPSFVGSSTHKFDEKADLVLITHGHRDHFDHRAIRAISKPETLVAGPQACVEKLTGQIKIVSSQEVFTSGDAAVMALNAYNRGLKGLFLHKRGKCFGYLIKIGGNVIYHAGDTDLVPEMRSIGPVDIALLPVSGLFCMNIENAVQAAKLIHPRIVIPMHQVMASQSVFKAALETDAPDIRVVLMSAGEEREL